MGYLERVLIITFIGLLSIISIHNLNTEGCNEATCASVVSKCMLTQSCKCEFKNCSCCKDCAHCLGHLYTECCSCVDLCPKPSTLTLNPLSKLSDVEDLSDPMDVLFSALTDQKDDLRRWITFNYPIEFDLSVYNPKLEKVIKYETIVAEQEVAPRKDKNKIVLNCTVAFHSQCMSLTKCKSSCHSMGSSSYRWFHDGCCECVGRTCINYGINESRCLACPEREGADLLTDDTDDFYDENVEKTEKDKKEKPVEKKEKPVEKKEKPLDKKEKTDEDKKEE